MLLSARDVAKFGILVGLAAIFIDAIIAHGLFWDNDPYWTYWITKTFLITTVFTLGTAFFGVGLVQGLAITAVHTLILEIYYQWLAPVGLPQEPEWLDFNHLWTTGVPVHYLAIFAGYALALWIWRSAGPLARRDSDRREGDERRRSAKATALAALAATVVILVLDGIVTHALLFQRFPGITYFVQHLLVTFVFLYAWFAYMGEGASAWLVGALLLSLLWAAYAMYVGPTGLPEKVQYLGYEDLWLRAWPGALVAAGLGLWLTTRFVAPRIRGTGVALVLLVGGLSLVAPERAEAKAADARAAASGEAMMVVGPNPVDMRSVRPAQGSIAVRVVEGGNRWSHVQNTDVVEVVANFASGGSRYRVEADRAMPRHPHGNYTTWNGVVFNHAMHGDTGIGTAALPKMAPEIALWGWGKVWRDGKLIAPMAAIHVMAAKAGPMPGVMLEVETEDKGLIDAPDGYLTVMWPRATAITLPEGVKRSRQIAGWVGLIGLALLFVWLAHRAGRAEPDARPRRAVK